MKFAKAILQGSNFFLKKDFAAMFDCETCTFCGNKLC